MIVWGKITHKISRFLIIAGSIFGVLLIAGVIDLNFPLSQDGAANFRLAGRFAHGGIGKSRNG